MNNPGAWTPNSSCSGVLLYYLAWNTRRFNPLLWLAVQPDTKHLADRIISIANEIRQLNPVRADELDDQLVFFDRHDSPVYRVQVCPECACIMGGYHKVTCTFHEVEEVMLS